MELKVLVSAPKKESEKENQSIYVDDPNIDLECCAYLYPKVYEEIFGEKKKESPQNKQRLSVIKITKCNRKIYRKYVTKPLTGLKKNVIVISPNSCQQLGFTTNEVEKKVCVSKSWWFPFYLYHSNSATRISFRVGMISLLVGLIGLILSVISIIF